VGVGIKDVFCCRAYALSNIVVSDGFKDIDCKYLFERCPNDNIGGKSYADHHHYHFSLLGWMFTRNSIDMNPTMDGPKQCGVINVSVECIQLEEMINTVVHVLLNI
jgi:hypothetical protein